MARGACITASGGWSDGTDCEGMTCKGAFYSITGFVENGAVATPTCTDGPDCWPFTKRRWTPASQGPWAKPPSGPGGEGGGQGNTPPGYHYNQ